MQHLAILLEVPLTLLDPLMQHLAILLEVPLTLLVQLRLAMLPIPLELELLDLPPLLQL
jgi:hypothetical protein